MRLIDADALKAELGDTNMDILTDEAKELIDSEPTVAVVDITKRDLCEDINCEDCPFMQETCKLMDYVAYADRPHGEWIFNPKDAIELMFTKPKCSECGFESSDGGNFCPNCGADMRKETE